MFRLHLKDGRQECFWEHLGFFFQKQVLAAAKGKEGRPGGALIQEFAPQGACLTWLLLNV
jgi:hypothetical protein